MQLTLDYETVKRLGKIFKETEVTSVYRYDALKLLKKWDKKPGLKMSKETQDLIKELISQYEPKYI